MRPSLIADVLTARFNAHRAGNLRRAAYIEGLPGLGKTETPKQVARSLNVGYGSVHGPLMQPEDYGMPVVNADRTGVTFVVPAEKFPLVGSDHFPDEGIFVIEELPQADNAGQKILANMIQEREIHGRQLKPGWMIIATGNPQSSRAGANRVLSHLADRFTKYVYEPHLDDWCAWALDNGVATEVVSFLRFRPNLLCDFDAHREKNATPRGWSQGVSASIGTVPHEAEFETFCGDVGEGAAAEFVGFLRIYRKLPNPDVVLMNPDKHELPTDPATCYALAGAIANRATPDNFERVITVAERMAPEYMVLTVRDSIRRNREVQNTKAFIKWASGAGAKVLL